MTIRTRYYVLILPVHETYDIEMGTEYNRMRYAIFMTPGTCTVQLSQKPEQPHQVGVPRD